MSSEPQLIQQETRRRDLRVYEKRTEIEIEVRPRHQVVEGHVVPRGKHRIRVAESRVQDVMLLVETEADRADVERAKMMYQREVTKWTEAGHAPGAYPGSIEREFHKLAGRGMAPLLSCKVVATGIAPDLTEDQARTQGVLAQLVSLGTLVQQGGASPDAALQRENDELRARLAKLEEKAASKAKS